MKNKLILSIIILNIISTNNVQAAKQQTSNEKITEVSNLIRTKKEAYLKTISDYKNKNEDKIKREKLQNVSQEISLAKNYVKNTKTNLETTSKNLNNNVSQATNNLKTYENVISQAEKNISIAKDTSEKIFDLFIENRPKLKLAKENFDFLLKTYTKNNSSKLKNEEEITELSKLYSSKDFEPILQNYKNTYDTVSRLKVEMVDLALKSDLAKTPEERKPLRELLTKKAALSLKEQEKLIKLGKDYDLLFENHNDVAFPQNDFLQNIDADTVSQNIKSKIDKKTEEIVKIEKDLSSIKIPMEKVKTELKELQDIKNKLIKDSDSNNNIIAKNNIQITNTKNNAKNEELKLKELKEKLSAFEKEKIETEKKLNLKEKELASLEITYNDLSKEIEIIESKLAKYKNDYDKEIQKEYIKLNAVKHEKVIKALNQNNVLDVFESVATAHEGLKLPNDFLNSNEELQKLIVQLKDIKSNNPYAFSMKTNRDSIKSFEDNMGYLNIRPNEKEWIGQGKVISNFIKKGSKDSFKDEEGTITNSNDYKTSTNINGAIGIVEYGINNDTSLGFAIGGNNQTSNFKDSNSLKGTSVYLGTFVRKHINNYKFKAGVGYQFTDVKVTRNDLVNKYKQNSYDIFSEARYIFTLQENFTIEPKIKLSYFDINQDKIKEKYNDKNLAIGINQDNQKTGDLLVGLDFIKATQLKLGKLNTTLSVAVSKTLGNRTKELTGHIIGKNNNGSDFKLDSISIPKTSGIAGINVEFEQISGIIYNAGINFKISESYNRNLQLNIGAGYKF